MWQLEMHRTLVVICSCDESLSPLFSTEELIKSLKEDPAVSRVEIVSRICTAKGWEELAGLISTTDINRILIGACLPYVYTGKLRELGKQTGLDPKLMDIVDIRTPAFSMEKAAFSSIMERILKMGVAGVKHMDPLLVQKVPVIQKALVIGGGIAGMIAALDIADHGFDVNLVENNDRLGGNLAWLKRTIQDDDLECAINRALFNEYKNILKFRHILKHR
jgi:heterodisulfide reductase subunit A2